jgi:hypothetical protein
MRRAGLISNPLTLALFWGRNLKHAALIQFARRRESLFEILEAAAHLSARCFMLRDIFVHAPNDIVGHRLFNFLDLHGKPPRHSGALHAPVEQTGFVGEVQIKARCRPVLARTSAR